MKNYPNHKSMLKNYTVFLAMNEKSTLTIEKYTRDINSFIAYLSGRDITKLELLSYKSMISEKYAPSSVNSMLVSINSFLQFIGMSECRVKLLKLQKQIFANESKELSAREYRKLLNAAGQSRLAYILQTICETGIRISELKFITVEAVKSSRAVVDCKAKRRVILIPPHLRTTLLKYIKNAGIKTGTVFVTKGGKPLHRSNIWRAMKSLCEKAGVAEEKVFPHNLRHLFAKTFYSVERDIVKLADILGHSSINTTRIYTMESGKSHAEHLSRIHLRLMT